MTTLIRFEQVSKQYHLGIGRTSLREKVPHLLRRLIHQGDGAARSDHIIWALRDVTFGLEKGEALGIIGLNGAGKTTILKLLSDITRPTTGAITVNGRVSALIELGAGFHPDLTGLENLYLNAAILGITRREMATKLDSIIDFSGLREFMDTPVKRYSSGMYVRLGFAVAAHVDPDILLVDEVLAVGDASFQRKCIEQIHKLQERGTTIVFVSHNMNLVRSVCERGLFLLEGNVQAFGPITEAVRAYESSLRAREVRGAFRLNQTHLGLDAGPTPAEVVDIKLVKVNGPSANSFSFADDVEVRVSYRTQEIIRSPSLLARIIRSDGTTCCEIRTRNDDIWLPDLKGSGCVSFFLEPLQLASGAYTMEVRLQDTTDAALLAIGQSSWFQVSGRGVTVMYEYGGVYVPKVRWGFTACEERAKAQALFP